MDVLSQERTSDATGNQITECFDMCGAAYDLTRGGTSDHCQCSFDVTRRRGVLLRVQRLTLGVFAKRR